MRNVTFFIPNFFGGGAEKVVVTLANALSRIDGFNVSILAANSEGDFRDQVSKEVCVVSLNKKRMITSIFGIVRYFKKNDVDIFISSLNHANVFCVLGHIFSLSKAKLVLREDNVVRLPKGICLSSIKEAVVILLMRIFYRFSDSVIAISDPVAASLSAYGVATKKLIVIGNPIDTNKFECPAVNATVEFELPDNYICAIGRLSEQKGFDILIQAFSKIKNKQVKLLIVGEGEKRARLEEIISSLGLVDRVIIPGFTAYPEVVLVRSRAFVLSSRWEGFGNVLVEALASGRPVIATDCPGAPRDILGGGAYGRLVQNESIEELADAMDEVLEHDFLNENARRERARLFAIDHIVSEYILKAID